MGITRKGQRENYTYIFEGSDKTTNGKLITYELDKQGNRTKIIGNYKYDPRTRPWYIETKKARKDIWLDVYPFFTWPKIGITATKPYFDKKGKLLGIIASDIILSDFSKFLNSLKIGKTGIAYIIGDDGLMIATSSLEPLTIKNKNNLERIHALDSSDFIIKNSTNEILKKFESFKNINDSSQISYLYNNKKYLLQITPFEKFTGFNFNWFIVVIIPEDDFMEHINANTKTTILLCILALLVSILIGIIITRKITEPIFSISKEMNHIANLELEKEEKLLASNLSEINIIQDSMLSMKKGLKSFEKYVSSDLVRRLIKNKKEASLGVEHAEVTVFFSDVVDFTTISEALPLNNLVDVISEYLGEMTNIILFSGGTLDKYIGDAIMAFWNEPEKIDNHELVACEVAIKCIKQLKILQKEWLKRGLPPLECRIGINTGSVLVGNLGSIKRMDYTVIGDTVNLASRLESLNKYYGTQIIISKEVYDKVYNNFLCRPLDLVTVKGKTKPTLIYELIDTRESATEKQFKLTELYILGLSFYQNKDFSKSKSLFKKVLEINPDDKASKKMLDRIFHFEMEPPSKDWNGVYSINEK